MATLMAVHQVEPHMRLEVAATLIYGVISRLSPGTQWLKYWLSDDTGQMFCLWSAPNAEAVWDILRKAAVPTSTVVEVEEGDPSLLMQGLDQ